MSHLGYLRGEHIRLPEHGADEPHWWSRLRPGAVWTSIRPKRIQDYRLAGPRRAGAIRIVVASDVSPSMDGFADARETAIGQLLTWVQANLRATDEIGVLDFSDTAAWRMTPTSIADLAQAGHHMSSTYAVPSGGTNLLPVLERSRQLSNTTARTCVWLISDGQYPDYPPDADTARRVLYDSGVDAMPLLVPSHAIQVPEDWPAVFPTQIWTPFDGRNPNQTAIAFARTLAQHTHQRLVLTSPHRPHRPTPGVEVSVRGR